jgi:hypothetical protein
MDGDCLNLEELVISDKHHCYFKIFNSHVDCSSTLDFAEPIFARILTFKMLWDVRSSDFRVRLN